MLKLSDLENLKSNLFRFFQGLQKESVWKLIYLIFIVGCVFAYTQIEAITGMLCQFLEFIIKHKVSWILVFITFGGKVLRDLIFQKIIFTSGFIPILQLILEAATMGVVLETGFMFLNALVVQFWSIPEVGVVVPEYFNVDYFGDFDFLTLAFASVFLIGYSLFEIKEIIWDCFFYMRTEKVSPTDEDEYAKKIVSQATDKVNSEIVTGLDKAIKIVNENKEKLE